MTVRTEDGGDMCYSAMVEADFRTYLRLTGAEMDFAQFAEIYGARASDRTVRIPRALDRNFDEPQSEEERAIRRAIDAYRTTETARLETEIFAQRKRLADAERKLSAKPTKAAAESRRIAENKVALALERLPLLKGAQPDANDERVFPMSFAPLVIREHGKAVVKLARYHCRQAGKAADIDRKYPGLYNARRDNLEGFWRNEFGVRHGVLLVHSFFENVQRDGQNSVLQFVPRPAEIMYIACVYSAWSDDSGKTLLSFAAITDEPPAEVRAAGHDRMIVSLQPANVARWLSPETQTAAALQGLLDDRPTPYYEHRIAA